MSQELNSRIEELVAPNRWLVMKHGLYYRPNAHGYTSNIQEAWIVSEAEADKHVYPHGDQPVTKRKAPARDYFNDLNAIHEAVLTLSDEVFIDKDGFKMTERVLFMQALERIVMRDTKVSECNFEFYNATAQQRTEAFECVKGL